MQYPNPYPFLNPTYGNYGQMPNIPPMPQPIGISGKYVNDFSEISASDIPMNSPAIFAKNDRSEVQIREWNSNGQIVSSSYKLVQEVAPDPKEPTFNLDNVLTPILARFEELEEKIDKLQKPTVARAKKEGE